MDDPFEQAAKDMQVGATAPVASEPTDPFSTAVNEMRGSNAPDISTAKSYMGSQNFNDFCQQFVELATTGKTGQYPSAVAAWNSQIHKAKNGMDGISPGDAIYFSPNAGNGYNGHTGIWLGGNQFISATDHGVQPENIDDWKHQTGQEVLGYIPYSEVRR